MIYLKSKISGFYKNCIEDRQSIIQELTKLTDKELKILKNYGYFTSEQLDSFIENTIGSYQLPIGIATNFLINNKEYLIPMVTEEPSIIAAASNAARFARKYGGFKCEPVESIMIGQIQISKINSSEINTISDFIIKNKEELLNYVNSKDKILHSLGGGAIDLQIRKINTINGTMIILHLLVNVLDAMGANAINTMVEGLANKIQNKIPGSIGLKIISNYAIHRIAKCKAIFDTEILGGDEVVLKILDAYAFAMADPFRAVTNNKGIMNGISALATATGNDTRAIEAGAHAFASINSKNNQYCSLSKYYLDEENRLNGELIIPMPIAIIGGIIKKHPLTQIALKILGVKSSEELSQIAVAVGLAQNIGALRALASEGIQAGHMKLHNRKFDCKD